MLRNVELDSASTSVTINKAIAAEKMVILDIAPVKLVSSHRGCKMVSAVTAGDVHKCGAVRAVELDLHHLATIPIFTLLPILLPPTITGQRRRSSTSPWINVVFGHDRSGQINPVVRYVHAHHFEAKGSRCRRG